MNLKSKYNQLFAGKPKSNDKDLLNEGTYLFGITTGKKPIKEVDDNSIEPVNFDQFNRQLAEIYDLVMDLEEQLDTVTADAFKATGVSVYNDLNSQGARYTQAIIKQIENLGNYIERTQQRISKLNR